MNRNGIPPNGSQPPVVGRPPQLFPFNVFYHGPGLPLTPVCQIQAPDVRAAALIALAQLGGDVRPLEAMRVEKVLSPIITPA